jgi:hypothetical protein
MKIRNSFVSNSSSCSFVIGKTYMTEEQISKFRDFIDWLCDREDDEPIPEEYQGLADIDEYPECTPLETKYYFVGEVDQHITGALSEYLERIGVNLKYVNCVS